MSKKKPVPMKAGRPPKADAKSRQTTREGQGRGADLGSAEARLKRLVLAGPGAVAGEDFPLDVLLARRLVTEAQAEEGRRFAALAWWLYGVPTASCSALYERMVAGGVMAGGPRLEELDPEQQAKRAAHIERQRTAHADMCRALIGPRRPVVVPVPVAGAALHAETLVPIPGPLYRLERRYPEAPAALAIAGALRDPQHVAQASPGHHTPYEAVRRCCQHLVRPEAVDRLATGALVTAAHLRELMLLQEGLGRLVVLRQAQERGQTRRIADQVRALEAV